MADRLVTLALGNGPQEGPVPPSFQHSVIEPAREHCSPDHVQPLAGYPPTPPQLPQQEQPLTYYIQMRDGHNMHTAGHTLHPPSDGSGPSIGSVLHHSPCNGQQVSSTVHNGGDPSLHPSTYQPVQIMQHPHTNLSMPATGVSKRPPTQTVHTMNSSGQPYPFHQSIQEITQCPPLTDSLPPGMWPSAQALHIMNNRGRAHPFHQSVQAITPHPLPVLSTPATGMSTWHPAQAVHTVNNGGQVHPFHQSVEAITQRPLPTHSAPATGMSTCPPTQFVHAVDSGRAPPFHQSAQTVHRGLPPPPISHVVSHDTATVEENTSRTIMAMNSRSLVTPSSFVGHYDAFRRVQGANPPQGTSETPRTALVRPQSRSQVPAVLTDYGLPRSETYHANGQVTSSRQLPNVAHIPYSTPEHHTVLGTSAPPWPSRQLTLRPIAAVDHK